MPCSYATPFAGPVLPLVNRIAARSFAPTSAVSNDRLSCARTSLRFAPPQNNRRPTVTHLRTLRNDFANITRATWASGIPTNASASISSRHWISFFRPIPGSINTGTAPILNKANVSTKNAIPGLTIRMVRIPRSIPYSLRPRAKRSTSSFNSRNEITDCPRQPAMALASDRREDGGR